jgi:hypothetical protein
LEKVIIDTANGPEEGLAVVKEVTIMDKPASEIDKDHTLAMDVLAALGSAGFNQWYEGTKTRRGGKLSTAAFNKIVSDLVKRNKVYRTETPSVWVDALGKKHRSKGLYQVVPEGQVLA